MHVQNFSLLTYLSRVFCYVLCWQWLRQLALLGYNNQPWLSLKNKRIIFHKAEIYEQHVSSVQKDKPWQCVLGSSAFILQSSCIGHACLLWYGMSYCHCMAIQLPFSSVWVPFKFSKTNISLKWTNVIATMGISPLLLQFFVEGTPKHKL